MVASIYSEIFTDEDLVKKIKQRLPRMFLLAEHDNSRNGKLGMEVGSARERILIALLMYKFGESNIDAELPITSPEIDVATKGVPLSIKTISGNRLAGVKLIWTVDRQKALEFTSNYTARCDMLLAQINWGNEGHLYLFTQEAQNEVLGKLGKERYMKLPKEGTNPRGVEISKDALEALSGHPKTYRIAIHFDRKEVAYNAYQRWLEHWQEP